MGRFVHFGYWLIAHNVQGNQSQNIYLVLLTSDAVVCCLRVCFGEEGWGASAAMKQTTMSKTHGSKHTVEKREPSMFLAEKDNQTLNGFRMEVFSSQNHKPLFDFCGTPCDAIKRPVNARTEHQLLEGESVVGRHPAPDMCHKTLEGRRLHHANGQHPLYVKHAEFNTKQTRWDGLTARRSTAHARNVVFGGGWFLASQPRQCLSRRNCCT